MLDLFKRDLPSSVEVEGRSYPVHTDFRFWINYANVIQDAQFKKATSLDLLDCAHSLFIKAPQNMEEALPALNTFLNPPCFVPRSTGYESSELIVDYRIDSDYIYAAFMEQYHIDLLTADMHWHVFQALLKALHDTELNKIISYRCYNPNDKTKYEESMKRLKEAWRLEQPSDEETQKDLDKFNSLFEK